MRFDDQKAGPSIRAYLFGTLRLAGADGKALDLPTLTPSRTLLAYLLLHHTEPHTRSQLAYLLAPDLPEDKARRILSQALWDVRRTLPADLIDAETERIQFLPGAVGSDVADFDAALHALHAEHLTGDQAAQLADVLADYNGDLLAEFYDDWVIPPREARREQYLQALQRLSGWEKANGRLEAALNYALKLTHVDPLWEAAHREVMRLYVALDRPEAALAQFETCRAILQDELAVDPDAETVQIITTLAERRPDRPAFVPAPRAQPIALNPKGIMPLVGRQTERTRLVSHINAATANDGGVVLVAGEPGVGKSRLLTEVAADAAWRGATVGWGNAQDHAAHIPYSPVCDALNDTLTPLRARQLAALLDPLWLAIAADLLPGLPDLPGPPDLPDDAAGLRLLEALARLTLALGELTPVVLILEDLHWGDEATFDLLAYLARRTLNSRVLIILSYREADARAEPAAWQGLQALDLAGVRDRLTVPPLTADAVTRFITRGLGLARPAPHFSTRLHQQTGGNPLLLLESLRLLHDEGTLTRTADGDWQTPFDASGYDGLTVPGGNTDLITRRLERLEPEAQTTLQTAAIIGKTVDFNLLQAANPLEIRATLRAIGTLVSRQFLIETPDAYQFSHDTVRDAVYRQIDPAARRERHRVIASAFDRDAPDALAYHYDQAGLPAQAEPYYAQAAHRAMQNHAPHTVLEYLTRLETSETGLPYDLLSLRAQAHKRLGHTERQIATIQQMIDRAPDATTQVSAMLELCDVYFTKGQAEAGFDLLRRAEALLKDLDAPDLRAHLDHTYAHGYFDSGDYEDALARYEAAHAHYQAIGDEVKSLQTLRGIVEIRGRTGDYTTSIDILNTIIPRLEAINDLRSTAHARLTLANMYSEKDDLKAARETYLAAAQLAESIGDRSLAAVGWANYATELARIGQHNEMIRIYAHTAQIFEEINEPRRAVQVHGNCALVQCQIFGDVDAADHHLTMARRYAGNTEDRMLLYILVEVSGLVDALRGEYARAQRQLADAGAIIAETGIEFLQVENARRQAMIALFDGQPERAVAVAEPFIHLDVPPAFLMGVYGTALAWCGRVEDGLHYSQAALEAQSEEQALGFYLDYWHAQVLMAAGQPGAARQTIEAAYERLLAYLDDLSPAQQAVSLANVPLHRAIQTTYEAFQPVIREMQLARISAPVRGDLTPDQQVTVRWTIYEAEDETISGKKERRQHRLTRLLQQTEAQGGVPTVEELAAVLETSAVTIKRDLSALRQAGIAVNTRGSRV
jgi:DNA-binding SARP family transcriptional activator/biotin operon repressor